MVNLSKLLYYCITLIVTVAVFMVTGEKTCTCKCSDVPKYALYSYAMGDEIFVKNIPAATIKATKDASNRCSDTKKIYRFPVEIIILVLFGVFMTGFVIWGL